MALHAENISSQYMNYAPADLNPHKDLPSGFFDFLLPLHKQFTPWQQKLVGKTRRSAADVASRTSAELSCRPRRRPLPTGASKCPTGAPISATR